MKRKVNTKPTDYDAGWPNENSDYLTANVHIASVGRLISGLLLVFWGFRLWNGSLVFPWISIFSTILVLFGLIFSAMSFRKNVPQWLSLIALIIMGVAFFVWIFLQVYQSPSYGTDELAFDQYAAQLWLHGINPYLVSLKPAFKEFLVPPIFYTYTLSGQTVTHLSYPALSFVLYIPALIVGLHAQAAVYVDTLAWIISACLLYFLLPPPWKWLSGLVLTFTQFDNYVVGGVSDALFVPFLMLALWKWDKFADPSETSASRWIGPIMLAAAMSIKQTPWFAAPFLAVGVAMESNSRKQSWVAITSRYIFIAVLSFLIANLPFDITNVHAWLRGIFLPLSSQTVPSGQGLVNLPVFNHIGGGNLHYFTYAGAFFVLSVLVAYSLFYESFKKLWPALIPLMFFWPTRSLGSYLIDLFPAILLAFMTVNTPSFRSFKFDPKRKYGLLTLPLSGFSVCIILALTTPQPLRISIVGEHSTGQFSTLDVLDVRVYNRSGSVLSPHFTISTNGAGQVTTFWNAIGPNKIPPHSTEVYSLTAPNTASMPSITAGLHIIAFTTHPEAISTSNLYLSNHLQTVLEPEAFNKYTPLHHVVHVTVQLRNKLGNRIYKSGVPIALGQIIYGENNVIPAETSINGNPQGYTPVIERTNTQGEAVFSIVKNQQQKDPVFYQAFIDLRHHFPFGYSNIVVINFPLTR